MVSCRMDFDANKMPSKVIREGAFGCTYFSDIFSGINGKWYKKSWKELNQLKDILSEVLLSDHCDVRVNKYRAKCRTSLRLQKNKGWINKIDLYGSFQWYFRYCLGRRSDDERQINRWRKTVSRFRGKLRKMINNAQSKYDDYSISPKIRQMILLHWGYKLTEKDFLLN